MARVSQVGFVVLVATIGGQGCVIGEPDFTAPAQTRPELTAVTPSTTELLRITPGSANTFDPLEFTVNVLSEDALEPVTAVLLLNYGQPNAALGGAPYLQKITRAKWPAGTNADGPRTHTISWTPFLVNETHACRTVTIIATHEQYSTAPFDECPSDGSDSDSITWFVSYCDNFGDCSIDDCLDNPPPEGFRYCPDNPAQVLTP